MQVFKLFFVFILCGAQLFAFSLTPINTRALVKSIYAPALFSVYSKEYGMLYCQLYGVASIYREFENEMCVIDKKAAREMRHFAMQYTRNKIFLEEQYRLGYKKGWCFLQNGGNLFNAQIVRDGYAVVQYFDISESKMLEDLQILENIARKEKRGLWREWEREMNCLKNSLQQISSEILEEE